MKLAGDRSSVDVCGVGPLCLFSVPSTQYHMSHNLSGRWLDSTLLNQGHAFAACSHVASLLYWDVVRGPSFPSRQIVT